MAAQCTKDKRTWRVATPSIFLLPALGGISIWLQRRILFRAPGMQRSFDRFLLNKNYLVTTWFAYVTCSNSRHFNYHGDEDHLKEQQHVALLWLQPPWRVWQNQGHLCCSLSHKLHSAFDHLQNTTPKMHAVQMRALLCFLFLHYLALLYFVLLCSAQLCFALFSFVLFCSRLQVAATLAPHCLAAPADPVSVPVLCIHCIFWSFGYFGVLDILKFGILRYENSTLILYKELSSPIFQSCEWVSEASVTPVQISTFCNI